jgi:hypothetical protein
MEDITVEEGNYGMSEVSSVVLFGWKVLCVCVCLMEIVVPAFLCFSSLLSGVFHYNMFPVEYQTAPSMQWNPCMYEQSVVVELVDTQFTAFVDRVKTTDCQAELRRLLDAGPPIYISDKHAMPLPDNGDTHIIQLWYASDKKERSAKLKGAVEGEERQALWDELKQFIIVDGKEPGDEEEEEGGGSGGAGAAGETTQSNEQTTAVSTAES